MEYYQSLQQIPQGTPEWYKKRTEILTSTQIASILHLNSHRSYDELLKVQADIEPWVKPTITSKNAHDISPMDWGTLLEPVAIQHLEQTTKKAVGALGLKVHDSIPYLGASPDGVQIVDGRPRLIEIKCPKKRQITYRVPLEYWVQVQIAMEVWNIDQALYCEYKFNITTEAPTATDLTVTYGTLARGVYWIYVDSWKYQINRNKQWFQRIKSQIDNFYRIKFTPTFTPAAIPSTVQSSSATQSSQSKSKRKRSDDPNEIISKNKSLAIQPSQLSSKMKIRASRYAIKERIPVSRFENFLQNDPILDWLEFHQGTEHKWVREKDAFLDVYNQVNNQFKLNQINRIITTADKKAISYRILNPSIHNLLNIYNNNLLLKVPHDINVLEATGHAIDDGIGIIFMGQLAIDIDEHYIWDTFDMIISQSAFKKLFPQESAELLELAPELNDLKYIPIKFKYTTLEFRKNTKYLLSKHRLDILKIGAITTALILDRHDQFGVIPEHDDLDIFRQGLDWFKRIETTPLTDLYPNMKNGRDSQWHHAKKEIAEDLEELTQISYLNYENREKLHSMNITKISQLKEEHIQDMRYSDRIVAHISEGLYLPKLPLYNPQSMNDDNNNDDESTIDIDMDQDMDSLSVPIERAVTPELEIFLDFENCTSLLTEESIIFMMGVLIKERNCDPDYRPFLVRNLDKESEVRMLTDGLKFIRSKCQKHKMVAIYHWSQAEPVLLRKAGFQLPSNTYWVDLYQHFLKNKATIPNCYTYGLKDVAKSLHKIGKIQSNWLNGLDGTTAMAMAWNIQHKCEITGDKFDEDPRIRKLCEYNYVDCQVLLEIRRLL
jgi:putative phage-type endonuclease